MSRNIENASESDGDTSHESDAESEDGWEEFEPDNEAVMVQDLFSSDSDKISFNTVVELVEHTKTAWGIDLVKLRKDLNLDFLEVAKFVNYCRSFSENGPPDLSSKEIWADEKFLKPVLEGDVLLYALDGVLEEMGKSMSDSQHGREEADSEKRALLARVEALTSQMQILETNWRNYKMAVDEQLDKRWQHAETVNKYRRSPSVNQRERNYEDQDYFKSYSYTEIHETMLKDTVRTDAYRDFIYNNKNLFKDKTVLDVGCGTGILSLFAAKAGARKVIAVDESDIIQKARVNAFENGLQDVIQCLHGTIESLLLPVEKVDIIISEWMGYALLFEAMLPSVLYARDKYLAPDGLMVPSHTTLRIAPYADPDYIADHLSFWRDVYGFKMSAMLEGAYDEAIIMQVPNSSVVGPGQTFWMANLHTITVEHLESQDKTFSLDIRETIDRLDGFVIWFDTFFATDHDVTLDKDTEATHWTTQGKIAFTTGPNAKRTHWQQAVLLIDPNIETVSQVFNGVDPLPQRTGTDATPEVDEDTEEVQARDIGRGETIDGEISFTPTEEDKRALKIEVRWSRNQIGLKDEQQWALA